MRSEAMTVQTLAQQQLRLMSLLLLDFGAEWSSSFVGSGPGNFTITLNELCET